MLYLKKTHSLAVLLLCAAVLVLLLSGCGGIPAPTDAPDAPAPTAEPTPEATPWAPAQAITDITACSPAANPMLAFCGDTSAIVSWSEYYGQEMTQCRTTVCALDLAADSVTAQKTWDRELTLLENTYEDGAVVLVAAGDAKAFIALSPALDTLWELDAPAMGAAFSYDLSTCYYVHSERLFALDIASGQSREIANEYGMPVTAISSADPESGLLTLCMRASSFSGDLLYGVLDPATGTLRALKSISFDPGVRGDSFLCSWYDMDAGCQTVSWGDGSGMRSLDLRQVDSAEASSRTIPGSGYVFCSFDTWGTEENPDAVTSVYRLLRLDSAASVCDLDAQGISGYFLSAAWNGESGLMLAAIYDRNTSGYRILLLDPDAMPFETLSQPAVQSLPATVDNAPVSAWLSEINGNVSADLLELRARANGLEDAYGVRILLSSQCEPALRNSGYTVLTTDRDGGMDEPARIAEALDSLSTAFQLYPEGFLKQFCTDSGDGGLCFTLSSHIESEYGVTGFHTDSALWNLINLDISFTSDVMPNVCHEIWHATEERINTYDPELLFDGSWEACNPMGAQYFYSYTEYLPDAYMWTYFGDSGSGREIAFVDSYGRTFPKEDRARLMEYVMGRTDYADLLIQYAPIYQKYQILCAATRAAFDDTGWENVWWERYL